MLIYYLYDIQMIHKRVADTSILYPHLQSENHKNSLKYLALKFLHEEVQSGSHDSIQDAATALKLFLLKVKHGHVRSGLKFSYLLDSVLSDVCDKSSSGFRSASTR